MTSHSQARSCFTHLLAFFLCLVPCALCLAVSGCHAADPARLCFKDLCYQVDVVDTPQTREQGLMFRKEMLPGQGMFFIFEQNGEYAFWMKNMNFPIDILWINETMEIVHIAENVPPCQKDPCPVYFPKAQARYVLELPAGESRHIRQGEKAIFFNR